MYIHELVTIKPNIFKANFRCHHKVTIDKIMIEEYLILEAEFRASHRGQVEPVGHAPFTAFLTELLYTELQFSSARFFVTDGCKRGRFTGIGGTHDVQK
ncbi:MAG: hypothetical protein A4E71_03350 [Smithella sp. PtaU1.Bin162]|nr:MAG: hypothetical protein A4E71_03350 [Smithella sp. PtaU1.Bin162]